MPRLRGVFVASLIGLLIVALIPASRAGGSSPRPMLVRVHVDTAGEAAYLMSHFDETHNHAADEIELLLWPGDRAELDSLGLSYEVVVEDLFAHDMAASDGTLPRLSLPGPDRSDYRRLNDYNKEMKRLAKKHPKLVELFKMKRKSLEGRTIYGVEIATNVKKHNDGRPIFYIDAVHHAREWPASEYTMLYVHYLVEKYGKDREITSLLKRSRLIAVPIVNVDGFDYSRESVFSYNQDLRNRTSLMAAGNGFEGYWRKNRRSFTGVTAPGAKVNPDAYGVDPNRNYSYLWGDSHGGSSGLLVDQTYRGAAPFSEPETKNVRDIILGRNVTAVLTNHTYQGSVLRTGGGDAPEDGMLRRLGGKMARVLKYRNAPTVGYPTTGTTDDWAYAAMAAIGYTIEHGIMGFHPAYNMEVGAFWKQHMKAFTILHEAAAAPRYHSVIKGRIGGGGRAFLQLRKSFKTPLSPGNPVGKKSVTEKLRWTTSTNKNGTFVWHVTPSSRPYEKKSESYKLEIVRAGPGKSVDPSETKTIRVKVKRGQVKNLGTIRL